MAPLQVASEGEARGPPGDLFCDTFQQGMGDSGRTIGSHDDGFRRQILARGQISLCRMVVTNLVSIALPFRHLSRCPKERRTPPLVVRRSSRTYIKLWKTRSRRGEDGNYQEKCARAYALFFARGGEEGDDSDDWLRAEAELRCEKE